MGALKKLLVVVGAVILLSIVTSFFIPNDYSVERKVNIDAQPSEIYPYVVDLREWQKWGVWFKRDPSMKLDYSGPDREITQLEHNKRVLYRLYFPEFDMGSSGVVEIESTDNGSTVIWRDEGSVDNNPINKLFVLMMDSMIGPDFEMGLENLKVLVENNG